MQFARSTYSLRAKVCLFHLLRGDLRFPLTYTFLNCLSIWIRSISRTCGYVEKKEKTGGLTVDVAVFFDSFSLSSVCASRNYPHYLWTTRETQGQLFHHIRRYFPSNNISSGVKTTPHIWGVADTEFSIKSGHFRVFIHRAPCLSTDKVILSTVLSKKNGKT
jgi:hypothetical protein